MNKRGWGAAVAALLCTSTLAGPAAAAPRKLEPLNQYKVSGGNTQSLGQLGYDASEGGAGAVVATPAQADALRAKGFTVTPIGRRRSPRRPRRLIRSRIPPHGYDVFRPWHLTPAPCPGTCSGAVDGAGKPINLKTWYEPAGGRASRPGQEGRLRQVAATARTSSPTRSPQNANTLPTAPSPSSGTRRTQHAREWIATEVGRRLFGVRARPRDRQRDGHPHAAEEHGDVVRPGRQPRRLRLDVPEQEHAPVAQEPRDNDGDDVLTGHDGVDTNRNWAEKWRYDQEGAADAFDQRHLPRHVGRVRARGQLADALIGADQAEVPDRLPLLRRR